MTKVRAMSPDAVQLADNGLTGGWVAVRCDVARLRGVDRPEGAAAGPG